MSISGLGEIADLVGKFFPDKTQEEKDKFALELQQLQNTQDVTMENLKTQAAVSSNQTDINKVEAGSTNFFVAGWRPGIGWSCACAFFWTYVLAPLATFICNAVGHPVTLPTLDIGTMMPVLLGMLGLGGMRTYEKTQGVASGH
jgi:hypothetical protein